MSDITEEEIATIIRGAMLSDPQHGTFTERMEQRTAVCSEATRAVLALLQPALERARREERERERERCAVMADAMAEDMAISIGKIGSQMTLDRYQVGANDIWSVAAAIRKG